MNIFDFAMQMEKDGENYYRELAGKSSNKGVTSILNMLADEEVKHYELMKKMKTHNPSLGETPIMKNVKNVFSEMKNSGEKFDFESSQKDLYLKAQELEKKSEDFYREKAAEVGEKPKKDVLLKIAEEEKKHYHILENIIEFITKPETYLEDAEFSNLGDDENIL